MNWLENHLGSLGYAGDFYIPTRGNGGVGIGDQKKTIAGEEQIKHQDDNRPPRVIETNKYDYPRIQKFFEWEQFLNWVDWQGHEGRRSSQDTSNKYYQFTLTHSFQEAMRLARYGWLDGLRQIKNMLDLDVPIKQIIQQSYNMETCYDVVGGSVNIGRYLMGMPDCMRHVSSTQDHALPARIQKVLICGDYDCNTSADTVLRHGFNVYQIIEALEQANIQTEITIAFHANKYYMYAINDYYFYETYIKIKEPYDIIYPEKLLFCLAHPSMLRRLVFSEHERNPRKVRNFYRFYSGGPGYGTHIPQWRPPECMLQDTLLIPNLQTSNMSEIIEKVQSMIKSQYEQAR